MLEDLLIASGCAHVDETGCPRADCGGKGHAWASSCPWAAMIVFHRSRSGDMFDGALRFLLGAVAVVDGCVVHREVFREIRRCWRHIVNNPRAAAARAAGAEAGTIRALYGRLCGLYERIRDRDTASESERRAILKEVQEMATAPPEGHPSRIEILNAGDALVTFPKCKDMPPTNNPGEGVVRRGPVGHGNVGYLLRSAEGAKALGTLISFHVTCMLQGLDPVNTLIRILKGEGLQCIFEAAAPSRGGGNGGGKPDRPEKVWRHPVAGLRAASTAANAGGAAKRGNLPVPAAGQRSGNLPVPAAGQRSGNLPVLAAAPERQLPVLAARQKVGESAMQPAPQIFTRMPKSRGLLDAAGLICAALAAALARPPIASALSACALRQSLLSFEPPPLPRAVRAPAPGRDGQPRLPAAPWPPAARAAALVPGRDGRPHQPQAWAAPSLSRAHQRTDADRAARPASLLAGRPGRTGRPGQCTRRESQTH